MFDRGLEHTLGTSFWKCKPKDINIHCSLSMQHIFPYWQEKIRKVALLGYQSGVASIIFLNLSEIPVLWVAELN